MFPSASNFKVMCPEVDCPRTHCPYYHHDRKPLWISHRKKPWLDQSSAMITLVKNNVCPTPGCSITLPPKSGAGPRPQFNPVIIPPPSTQKPDPQKPVQNTAPVLNTATVDVSPRVTSPVNPSYVPPSVSAPEYSSLYMPSPISYAPQPPQFSVPIRTPSPSTSTSATPSTSSSNMQHVPVQTSETVPVVKKMIKQELTEAEEVEFIAVVKREPDLPPEPPKKKLKPLDLPMPKLPASKQSPPTVAKPSTSPTPAVQSPALAEQLAQLQEDVEMLRKITELEQQKRELLRNLSFDAIAPLAMELGSPRPHGSVEPTVDSTVYDDNLMEDIEPPRKLKKKPAIEVDEDLEMDVAPEPVEEYVPTPISELEKEKERKEQRRREKEAKREKEEREREIARKEKEAVKRNEEKRQQEKEKRKKEKEKQKRREERKAREEEEMLEKAAKEKEKKLKKSKRRSLSDLFDDSDNDSDIQVISSISRPDSSNKRVEKRRHSAEEKTEKDKSSSTCKPSSSKQPKLSEEQRMAALARTVPTTHRVAHSAVAATTSVSTAKPKRNTPYQQLAERMQKIEEEKAERERMDKGQTKTKKTSTEFDKYGDTGVRASTVPKGEIRAAHKQQTPSSSCAQPRLRDRLDAKIPAKIRQMYLMKLFEEFRVHYSDAEAAQKAEIDEQRIKARTTAKTYSQACTHAIQNIRKLTAPPKPSTASTKVSHLAVMAGRHVNDISIGVNKKKSIDWTEENFYNAMTEKYLMTEEQLISNGYALWCDEAKTLVKIKENPMDKEKNIKRWADDSDLSRRCCRCGKEFKILKTGEVMKADCLYHFGKQWKKKENHWEPRFNCCEGDLNSPCCVAEYHVTETLKKSDLQEFREFDPPLSAKDHRSRRVFALDCEMVYTVWGPALARISIVDMNDDLVFDVLVKPPHKVIDANTRFSGLTIEQVERAKETIKSAFDQMCRLINQETILIGHSLESDLKSMHIVHTKVVDTSVVFPHRMGPPMKKALRTLAGEILQKIIQEDVDGHDSKEDASACMQLMLHKVKHD